MSNRNFSKCWGNNWFSIFSLSAKILFYLSIGLFLFSLICYYLFDLDFLLGIKIAVVCYFSSQIFKILLSLKGI
jgi:hypothetical protein